MYLCYDVALTIFPQKVELLKVNFLELHVD